jgi:formiminotetrahydrofolate cyclodeaminase
VLSNLSIKDFLEKTASGDPVPGGGSVAALSAALAAGLSEMVAHLTIGKKDFEHVEVEMKAISSDAKNYRIKLTGDIDRDSDAFNAVMAAFRLPKATDQEKSKRTQAIQDSFRTAALVPLEVAKSGYEIMDLAEKAVKKGNKNAITDALVAAMMARTAVLSALYNVKINLGSITDSDFVNSVSEQVKLLEAAVEQKEKEIRLNADL